MKNEINNLINKILCLSGDKIITLASNYDGVFKIDINQNNEIGYISEHEHLFRAKLINAMRYGGGMIIRQFLSLKVKRTALNGKEMWFPEKNIYGVILGNDGWINMDIQNLKQACETDATGQSISKEIGIHYKMFPS